MPDNHKSIQAANVTTLVSVIVNILLCIIKTVTGVISGSTVLIADGIHSLADLITDIFTYAILRVANTDPDDEHPYGHGKFETFGTMFLSIFLAVVAIAIGYEAMSDINNPESRSQLSTIALVAAVISILGNEGLYHFCTYKGKQVNSPIILANAWHHRTDSISSIAALIGISLNMMGFLIADAIAALFVTLFLLKISYTIGRGAFDELVDASVDEETLTKIKSTVSMVNGVIDYHQLRARRIGGKVFIDVHADVPSNISVSEGHAIAHSIEESLNTNIEHVADITVHIDPFKALQNALPSQLYRETLTPLLESIIAKHISGVTINNMYLHILEDGYNAEITLQNASITSAQVTALKKELEGDKTPLAHVHINIRHT